MSRSTPHPPRSSSRAPASWLLLPVAALLLTLAVLSYRAIATDAGGTVIALGATPDTPLEYLSDPAGQLKPADFLTGAGGPVFQRLPTEGTELPRGPHWLRFRLPAGVASGSHAVLEFANAYIDEVAVYPLGGDAAMAPGRTGQKVPLHERGVRSHLPAVSLPAAGADPVYVVHSTGWLDRPTGLRLWTLPEEFRRYELRQLLPLAAYFGLWTALVVYSVFVFIVLRDGVVLRYLAYLVPVGGLALIGTNFSAWFFTGPSGLGRELAVFLFLLSSCGALVHFSRGFLDTARCAPRLDTVLTGLLWGNVLACVLAALLTAAGRLEWVASTFYLLALITLSALPVAGLFLALRGLRQAWLYVVAFACFAAGLVWMILSQLGYAPADTTGGAPFLLGSALELLLLSIAVAYRYRLIREDHDRLQATYTARLEAEVAARTNELSTANADKDRLISLVAHDVRSPLASLKAVSHGLVRAAASTPGEFAETAGALRRRCDDLLALVDNVLAWGRLRTGHLTREPSRLNLAGVVEQAISPLVSFAVAKKIGISYEIAPTLEVHADGFAVECIVRNLVSNAIKFTPAEGRITLSAHPRQAHLELHVRDTGVGIAPERLATLSRALSARSHVGTAGETGVGIGLALCCELAEREGGALRLDSPADASATSPGAIAILALPVPP